MVVVHLGAAQHRQMIPGMVHQRVHHDEREPHHKRKHVAAHNGRPNINRQQIADDELERMGVHGRPGNRGRPLVVLLVHALVEIARVQQPVAVVERNLPEHDTEQQIAKHDRQRGQDARIRWLEKDELAQRKSEVGRRDAVQELIAQHHFDEIFAPAPLERFVCARLIFVLAQGGGPVGQVHQHEQPTDQPEEGVRVDGQESDVERHVVITLKVATGTKRKRKREREREIESR